MVYGVLTFDWVDWYNNRRLYSTLGHIPPEEYEIPARGIRDQTAHEKTKPPTKPMKRRSRQQNGAMKTGTVHDERHLEARERHGVTARRLCLVVGGRVAYGYPTTGSDERADSESACCARSSGNTCVISMRR